jgi:ATP-dependent Lon protease
MDELKMIENKIDFFINVVEKTFLHIKRNRTIQILSENEYNMGHQSLLHVNEKIHEIKEVISKQYEKDVIISKLQIINNELSSILKSYGTCSFDKLLTVCFGNNKYKYIQQSDSLLYFKNDALKNYFHPTGYKVVNHKNNENINVNQFEFECSDIAQSSTIFYSKVYGIKVFIKNVSSDKSILVYGIVDDIAIPFVYNSFLFNKFREMKNHMSSSDETLYSIEMFRQYTSSLTIKDLLAYSHTELYNKFIELHYSYTNLKKQHLNSIIKEFLLSDLFSKRRTILLFYYNTHEYENKIIVQILFDLLSSNNEQFTLLNSLPISIQPFFFLSNKNTINNQSDFTNKEVQSISIEQRIQLLKTSTSVKEKAFAKLKEIKMKSDDNNSKAKHFLDGLLNIPFGLVRTEPILNVVSKNQYYFQCIYDKLQKKNDIQFDIPKKEKYTNMEIMIYCNKMKQLYLNEYKMNINQRLTRGDKQQLTENIYSILSILNEKNCNIDKKYTKNELKDFILQLIQKSMINETHMNKLYQLSISTSSEIDNTIHTHLEKIQQNTRFINEYISEMENILDKYVYGNVSAKSQILKIIGQWINGENKGYCFGFEGPPGVGKTTLAKKGIAYCLKDEHGASRPFAFMQMGGDTNGSTLNGHNYTYVGSSWGSIVQILMDTKIINPIIYIDEIDKISKTEHGRELIGILTHLLDFSQNDKYQDKYFNGIEIDMSKALFIVSYNDPNFIDPILLDRIHRVKFHYLSIQDKIIITKKHLLPTILFDMGLEDMITIQDNEIQFLIEKYTSESGVRKLKEILFEIIGEINIHLLKNTITVDNYPLQLTIQDIQKYLKERPQMVTSQISHSNEVGIINGMWANSIGQGGILKIFAQYFPSSHFMELKLTGLLEKVMQESMHVAQTLSWSLTPDSRQIEIMNDKKHFGIHIHAGEGSISKDGPSGGAAITTVIYSLLNDLKIRRNFAITGEIDLNGNICEIGSLDLKIIGSIKSGITSFIFPTENIKDYDKFLLLYKNHEMLTDITFHPVNHINQVFDIIFEK